MDSLKREDEKLASGKLRKGQEDELGIRVTGLTSETARRFNVPESEGVIVVSVESDSKGMKAGIQRGDIIREINHRPVRTEADYAEAVDAVKDGDTIQMFIRRMSSGFMIIKMTK